MSGLEICCIVGGTCWCCCWLFGRCKYSGRQASKGWEPATYDEFHEVPRLCRILLAVYEEDVEKPVYADRLDVTRIIKLAKYADTEGQCPPYIIYVDHEAKDICLAVRGLNTSRLADYRILMDNKKGKQKFDGGYVHPGFLKAAAWLLDREMETIAAAAEQYPDYTVTLAGHSLGSGVVAMMIVVMLKNMEETGLTRDRLRCYCIAPARSTSLNLAVRYADTINSVALQDDFLPRTSAPIELILQAALCLPCAVFFTCLRDSFIPKQWKLQDPRRLYTPGRLFHIVYTEDCSCSEDQPSVLTAVPVDGRFENIVLSRTAIDDHSLMTIEKKCFQATEILLEHKEEDEKDAPPQQAMDRADVVKENRQEQVKAALQRAKTLKVANAKGSQEVLFGGSELMKAKPKTEPSPVVEEPQKAVTEEGAAEGEVAGAGAAAAVGAEGVAAAAVGAEGVAAAGAASGPEQSSEAGDGGAVTAADGETAAPATAAGGEKSSEVVEVEEVKEEKVEVKPGTPLRRATTIHKWGRIVNDLLALEEEEEKKKKKTRKQPGPAGGSDVKKGVEGEGSSSQQRWGKLKEAVLTKTLTGQVAGQ